jgi:two-component system sensor kinase FixL
MMAAQLDRAEFQLLESIPDALLITNQAGDILFVNERLGGLFGYSREELIGRSVSRLMPERFRHTHEQNLAAYARAPYVRPMGAAGVLWARHKSGQELPVEIYLSPFRRDGEMFVMAAIRDVSLRIKMEEELRRSRDELDERVRARTAELEETANRLLAEKEENARATARVRQLQDELSHLSRLSTIGEMAAGLGHELNQPLAAIVNYAQGCIHRMQSGEVEQDVLIDALQRISREAARGSEIITRFKRFARKQELHREWVSIDGLLFDALRLTEADVGRHEIALDLRVRGLLPQVYVDPIQLQQVVVNLVRNAIDAVVGQPKEGRRISVEVARPRDDAIEITVIDTGHGLKAESVERLFEAFFTTKPEGLGMGLSLSRRIIEAHGGELTAQPNADRGMTFRILLPVSDGLPHGQ